MVLDLAPIHELKLRTLATCEDITTTCAQLAVTCKQLKARCREWELNDDRATIPHGKRNNDDVARVDSNEIRAMEEIKISVNEIVGRETVHTGEPRRCEAIILRSTSCKKEIKARARGNGGRIAINNGSFTDSFENPPLVHKLPVGKTPEWKSHELWIGTGTGRALQAESRELGKQQLESSLSDEVTLLVTQVGIEVPNDSTMFARGRMDPRYSWKFNRKRGAEV
ncbi:unnamed protein product [Linum trigynum]|uniref:Uncharacterized protein n=1 Tax=Linum trigynum TaxID=586398 RepID=A0AAV2FZT4_9ROSI